ncbi:hypothetical protein HO133_002493 [Letharia lupina]|uniref:Uncharacterized protein n=1 Tax=Letharia lupina TaxID=560253 RepID=A0A8H6CC16_9LECA|nr:uncharacterized protein HO133_002493 [Letharia lupina]KAF6220813.1 hypothetical protein HO133_002493 [Letharia lupina]
MPPRWLRLLSKPYVFLPAGFLIINVAVSIFPDPPAVREANERKWAQAQQRREEAYERAVMEQIERANPGAFDRNWDPDRDRD